MSMEPEQVAARWFVLRYDEPPLARSRQAGIGIVDFLMGALSFGFAWYESKERALIEVLRRDDDTVAGPGEDVVEDELVR